MPIPMPSHERTFNVAITGISRAAELRDRLLGAVGAVAKANTAEVSFTRHTIASGGSVLDAVYAEPVGRPAMASILICHGIGEVVERWLKVQQLLAAHGAASLVFDYSGYGRSTGPVDAAQFEEDAVAAFAYLQRLTPREPVTLLGFSLGSGVAAAVVNRVEASQLVLCAAFTSFRAAAHSIGVPVRLASFIPPLWQAEKSLRGCSLPVLVVHGERDRMFPVKMAAELAACCGENAELRVVPGVAHNEPFQRPKLAYWGVILDWIDTQNNALRKGA